MVVYCVCVCILFDFFLLNFWIGIELELGAFDHVDWQLWFSWLIDEGIRFLLVINVKTYKGDNMLSGFGQILKIFN